MAMTGIVTITMQDIYKMPISQRNKYLKLCKDYNEKLDKELKDKTPQT
jgi:hypothetical protein